MISMKPARVFQVFAVGDNVVAHGLKAAPELNGKAGRIIAFVKDRASVQFDDGDRVNIKPVNLKSSVRVSFVFQRVDILAAYSQGMTQNCSQWSRQRNELKMVCWNTA